MLINLPSHSGDTSSLRETRERERERERETDRETKRDREKENNKLTYPSLDILKIYFLWIRIQDQQTSSTDLLRTVAHLLEYREHRP
jgi:hypothetical protein